jgi:CRP-like cAMP-binding protein
MTRKSENNHPLKKVALFADLEGDDLETVGRAVTQLDLPAGYVLMREGGLGRDMFVVMSGSLEISRGGEHVADIGPGEFVGEMAALTRTSRNATVTATTPVRVLHVDGRSMPSVIDSTAGIATRMLPIVAQRVESNRVLVDA